MEHPIRPRVAGDIVSRRPRKGQWDAFGTAQLRLNLSRKKRNIKIPLTAVLRPTIIIIAAAFFVFGSALAPTIFTRASGNTATDASSNTAERAQLEGQLQQLETQIDQYEGQIASYEKQGNTLSGQIGILNDKIAKLNLQIRATTLTLSELNQNIATTESRITTTQADIASKKMALSNLLQNL